MNDFFFEDIWKQRAKDETGETFVEDLASPEMEFEQYERTKEVELYKQIEKQAEYDENTRNLFEEINKGIRRYYQMIVKLEKARAVGEEKEAIEKADKDRHIAHEAVMGSLNALSRYVGKHKLDNEWRSVIGLHRTQVTNWIKKVAPYMALKTER